jgi:hypothetical protein
MIFHSAVFETDFPRLQLCIYRKAGVHPKPPRHAVWMVLVIKFLKKPADELPQITTGFRVALYFGNAIPFRKNQFVEVNQDLLLVVMFGEKCGYKIFQTLRICNSQSLPVIMVFVFKCHLSLLIVTVVAVCFAGCGHNESVTEWMQTIPMPTVQ